MFKKLRLVLVLALFSFIVNSHFSIVNALNSSITSEVTAITEEINHDVTIGSGGKLIVPANVTLSFHPGNKIIVQTGGELVVGDTSAIPATITPYDNKPLSGWQGIVNQGGTVTIRNALIWGAQEGINQTGGVSDIHGATFDMCTYALRINGGTTKIISNTFKNNRSGTGIYLNNIATPVLIAGNNFGTAGDGSDGINYSIYLVGTNNVDIRYNNFRDGNATTITFASGSDNSQVRIAYNNFYHHRDIYDPASYNYYFVVGVENESLDTATPVSVYNCYWENLDQKYTTISQILTGHLVPATAVTVGSPLSDPISVGSVDNNPPQLIETRPGQSLPEANLTVTLNDDFWGVNPDTVHISIVNKTSGQSYTAPIDAVLFNETGYIFKASVTLPTPSGNTQDYYWNIDAADYSGKQLLNAGNNLTLTITNSLNTVTTPAWQVGIYHLITIPINTTETDLKTYLNLIEPDSKLAIYQNSTATYLYNNDPGFSVSSLPGQGFWLKLGVNEDNASKTLSGTIPTGKVTLALAASGWYLIGNPFGPTGDLADLNFNNLSFTYEKTLGSGLQTYRFFDAVSDGVISFGLWGYNSVTGNYYLERNTLAKWKGYWIRVKRPCQINFNPTSFSNLSGSSVSWDLQLTATQNNSSDGANYLGMAGTAVSGVDVFDTEKPPVINGSIKSYFVLSGSTREYGIDYRSVNAPKEKWHYTVTGLTPGEARLNWGGLTALPSNWRIILLDNSTGRETDMRQTTNYRFTVNSESKRDFEIILTDLAGTALKISGVTLNRNPFAPSHGETVAVTYSLSKAATIEARVYDWVGNLVYIFPNFNGLGGVNQITWNGRNNNGHTVANGIYFCKITARDGSDRSSEIIKLAVVN